MRTTAISRHISHNRDGWMTLLLRLLGTAALYLCFGWLADNVYAENGLAGPPEPTRGSVWLQTDGGAYISALLLKTEVDIDVSGMTARALVKQRFSNISDSWAEAVYVFPLPENAAVDHFRLRIGERVIEGQIRERAHARRSYENAKNEGKRAGLIEQQRSNVFTTSLAHIAPGEEISIEIEYQQTLDYDDGRYRLRFPMVVGPRFLAANDPLPVQPDDTDVSTRVSDKPVNPIRLHVSLDAGLPLTELSSTYHAIDIRQTDLNRYSIALKHSDVVADRDFELVWRPETTHLPQAVVFSETDDDYEYVLLSVLPPDLESLGQRLLPRDIVFVLDVSGSMAGTSIEQARASLAYGLSRLKPGDRFNIIWFNDRTERLYPQAVPANTRNIRHAGNIINRLDANGGTVMLPALALALNEQAEPSRLRQIVFLTDGNVDNEKELFGLIDQRLGDNRLFTIGIGSAPNNYFTRKAARAGRGSFTYIGDINEVQQKTDALLQKLESPALVNIDISIEGQDVEMFPAPVPDLYLGEPLRVLVRGSQLGKTISLYGDYGESHWQQTVDLSAQTRHGGIRTAWARSKIAFLMERHHEAMSEYERDEIREQIVASSIDHHLVSHFASLVAVDVTPANSSGTLHKETLKTNLPRGWKPAGSQPTGTPQILVAQLNLPQTATRAPVHLMIASMLFALAMVFYLWRKML